MWRQDGIDASVDVVSQSQLAVQWFQLQDRIVAGQQDDCIADLRLFLFKGCDGIGCALCCGAEQQKATATATTQVDFVIFEIVDISGGLFLFLLFFASLERCQLFFELVDGRLQLIDVVL